MSTNDVLSKLKAEIESRMGDCDANSKNPNQLLWAELAALIPFIDYLQQEQSCDTCTNDKGCVTCKDGELWKGKEQPCEELEKEFQEFCKDYPFPWSSAYINAECIEELCKGVAKHFYELGNKSHWKPSEEQIECLRKTLAKETGYERTILRSLFQELITLL